MTKELLKLIAEKAKVLNVPDNLGLAKIFIELSEQISNIKIPETDLSSIENRLEKLDNKLDEETKVIIKIV